MAKTTDITGTFRVPQEAWGSFWNFMLTLDGADITPNTRTTKAQPAQRPKNGKASSGTTGVCLVIRLASSGPITPAQVSELLEMNGKAKTGGGSILTWCKSEGLLKHNEKNKVYTITAAGNKYLENKCPL